MTSWRQVALVAMAMLGGRSAATLDGQAPPPALEIVTDEADAAMAILARRRAGAAVEEAAWRRLFATEGYRRLKGREAAIGRAFDDSTFQAFLLADTLLARAPELERTLAAWKTIRPDGPAARALAYLPAGTRLRARVYLLVKPRTNSFVFEVDIDPAIMLYLDPARTAAQLENTIAHELHHVGYAAACRAPTDSAADPALSAALGWLGAFGEGVAMLAAAGGPDVHPHATSAAEDRARWDRDVGNAGEDLRRVERFLLDLLEGRLTDPDSSRRAGMSFFGVQGPWYTVGWVMASTTERGAGRAALVDALCEPAVLLHRYNEAARRSGQPALPLWSDELLARLPLPAARAPASEDRP
jgi:hypothetical protein